MRDIEECEFLSGCKASLKDTSFDKAEHCYMTNSTLPVINFDTAMENYHRKIGGAERPKSNDALFVIHDMYYFVEFKNGKLNPDKIHEIKGKIFESLLIFCDMLKTTISFTRAHMCYILVFNWDKNEGIIEDWQKKTHREFLSSRSRRKIIDELGKLSKKHPDWWYLQQKFEQIYLKKVYAYSKEEFEQWLQSNTK